MVVGPIDAHHEAELVVPAQRMILGELPFKEFQIAHALGVDCILPRGRRDQTVNGMGHQAPDQGGRERRVSSSEVASPCGVGLPLGQILQR